MKPAFGGIDFGTSNSTVGIIDNGAARLVPVEGDAVTIPSAVFFNFEDGFTYFGRRAIEDYTLNSEGRLMRALKSVLEAVDKWADKHIPDDFCPSSGACEHAPDMAPQDDNP